MASDDDEFNTEDEEERVMVCAHNKHTKSHIYVNNMNLYGLMHKWLIN